MSGTREVPAGIEPQLWHQFIALADRLGTERDQVITATDIVTHLGVSQTMASTLIDALVALSATHADPEQRWEKIGAAEKRRP